jgi:hypothetical protein
MKFAFLQGRLNLVQCPQCGFASVPAVPLLYYDLDKELAFVFVPPEIGLNQDKVIGDLSNMLVNNLPSEARKFYLFQPKPFLSLESMSKAILAADGITEEMLNARQAKIRLIEGLLQTPTEAAFNEQVQAQAAEIDAAFFELLTVSLQATYMGGDEAGTQTLMLLRSRLLQLKPEYRPIVAEIDAKLGLLLIESREDLLERLQNTTSPEEFESLVASSHTLLDYAFFQHLTAQIEAAAQHGQKKKANALKNLRSKILDTKAHQEETSQAALQKAASLLRAILQSAHPDQLLAERIQEIDEAFFVVLSAHIEEARRQGNEETAKGLEMIGSIVIGMLQEAAPAESAPGVILPNR